MGGIVSRVLHGKKDQNGEKPKGRKVRRFWSLRRRQTDENDERNPVVRSQTMPSRQRQEVRDETGSVQSARTDTPVHERAEKKGEMPPAEQAGLHPGQTTVISEVETRESPAGGIYYHKKATTNSGGPANNEAAMQETKEEFTVISQSAVSEIPNQEASKSKVSEQMPDMEKDFLPEYVQDMPAPSEHMEEMKIEPESNVSQHLAPLPATGVEEVKEEVISHVDLGAPVPATIVEQKVNGKVYPEEHLEEYQFENKPLEEHVEENLGAEHVEQKAGEEHIAGVPGGEYPEDKPAEGYVGEHPPEENPAEQQVQEIPTNEHVEEKQFEGHVEHPFEEKPFEGDAGEHPSEEKPSEEHVEGNQLEGYVEEHPSEERPAEEHLLEEKPAEQFLLEEKPLEGYVEEHPSEEKPAEEHLPEERPLEGYVEEHPSEDKPAEEHLPEEKPFEGYVAEHSFDAKPGDGRTEENPTEEHLTDEHPNGEQAEGRLNVEHMHDTSLEERLTEDHTEIQPAVQQETQSEHDENKPEAEQTDATKEASLPVNQEQVHGIFNAEEHLDAADELIRTEPVADEKIHLPEYIGDKSELEEKRAEVNGYTEEQVVNESH